MNSENKSIRGFSYTKQKQSGRSMIEMLGVLAIVGILSAGGIAGYSMAMQNHKTNALIEKVQLIAQQTRTLYNGNYADLLPQNLIDAGMITDVNNPFGGTFLFSVSSIGTSSDIFSLNTGSIHNIPADACVKILTVDWGSSGMFWGIGVGTTNPAQAFRYSNNTYPVSKQTAVSACQGGNKIIHWWFK